MIPAERQKLILARLAERGVLSISELTELLDVSHMTVVDLRGERVRGLLRRLLANSVDKLKKPGKALYTCMLDERGGVLGAM